MYKLETPKHTQKYNLKFSCLKMSSVELVYIVIKREKRFSKVWSFHFALGVYYLDQYFLLKRSISVRSTCLFNTGPTQKARQNVQKRNKIDWDDWKFTEDVKESRKYSSVQVVKMSGFTSRSQNTVSGIKLFVYDSSFWKERSDWPKSTEPVAKKLTRWAVRLLSSSSIHYFPCFSSKYKLELTTNFDMIYFRRELSVTRLSSRSLARWTGYGYNRKVSWI